MIDRQLLDYRAFRRFTIRCAVNFGVLIPPLLADDVRQPEPVRGAPGPEPVHGAGGGVGAGGAPRPRLGEAAEKSKFFKYQPLQNYIFHQYKFK